MWKNYTTISQKHEENCEDSKIESTSSRLENMFLKIMPKHIKIKMTQVILYDKRYLKVINLFKRDIKNIYFEKGSYTEYMLKISKEAKLNIVNFVDLYEELKLK